MTNPNLPSLYRKWIDALRSGEYQQGRGLLNDTKNNYCCLGVLCEVAGLTSRQSSEYDEPSIYYEVSPDQFANLTLDEVIPIENIKGTRGLLFVSLKLPDYETYTYSLTGLNDNGLPFTAIADIIEHHTWLIDYKFSPPDPIPTEIKVGPYVLKTGIPAAEE